MTIPRDPLARWTALERPLRHLPRGAALAVLALLLAALAWSAWYVPQLGGAQDARVEQDAASGGSASGGSAIGDMVLYARIHARVAAGEPYYDVALEEQRANHYPTRPFVTVRLPTLAHAHGLLGESGMGVALLALLPISIIAFMAGPGGRAVPPERVGGGIAMLFAGAGVFADQAPHIHEMLAGLLLTLALVLYRPERWWPSLLLAALALAVRELALPFVLLWLAFAGAERRWREAAAVGGVVLLFALGMYLHYLGVTAQLMPGDRPSPGWNGLVGPGLPLLALSQLTALLFLPVWLAAPLALLPLLGWIGLGGRAGLFASLWFAGFFLLMALFARAENFYWVQMTLPLYAAGLAFVPRAMIDLASALSARGARQS